MPTSDTVAGLRMWKEVVPSLAMQCPYVYTGILAVAALHLLHTTNDSVALRTAACQYMGETVSLYRKDVGELVSQNAEARYIASVLITMHAKVRARYEGGTDMSYAPPVTYFVLQMGARDLWLMNAYCGVDFKDWIACYSHLDWPHRAPLPGNEHHINSGFESDPLLAFLELDDEIDSEQRVVYMHAMSYLELLKDCLQVGERTQWIRQRLSIAPCAFGDKFLALLQENDPISLLILARFFALFTFVDNVWWLEGTAIHEVRGLTSLVPDEWEWAISWPLEILKNVISEADQDMFGSLRTWSRSPNS